MTSLQYFTEGSIPGNATLWVEVCVLNIVFFFPKHLTPTLHTPGLHKSNAQTPLCPECAHTHAQTPSASKATAPFPLWVHAHRRHAALCRSSPTRRCRCCPSTPPALTCAAVKLGVYCLQTDFTNSRNSQRCEFVWFIWKNKTKNFSTFLFWVVLVLLFYYFIFLLDTAQGFKFQSNHKHLRRASGIF